MTQTITIKDPQAPATQAQVSYLTSLVAKHECPTVAEKFAFSQKMGFLAKGAASKLIDEAKNSPVKTAKSGTFVVEHPPLQQTLKSPATPVTQDDGSVAMMAPELVMPAFGYYEIDGTIYYWDITGKDAYPTLRRLTVVNLYDGTKKGKWSKVYVPWKPELQIMATWTPYAGKGYNKSEVTKKVTLPQVLLDAVAKGAKPLTSAEVGAKGKAFTFCVRCGATLSDPVSVANGIGPVCITYWS